MQITHEYFRRYVKAGGAFVGFDCDDRSLGFAIKEAGDEPFPLPPISRTKASTPSTAVKRSMTGSVAMTSRAPTKKPFWRLTRRGFTASIEKTA